MQHYDIEQRIVPQAILRYPRLCGRGDYPARVVVRTCGGHVRRASPRGVELDPGGRRRGFPGPKSREVEVRLG